MAIVEYTCLEPSLFYYGGFKLLEYPTKISSPLNYLFAEIFVDPWNNWNLIRRVFETFGTSSTVSNASFSKNSDIGDGVKTSWLLNSTSIGILVQCYNIAKDLGILVDEDASKITFVAVPDAAERVARKKWQACATQYQIIKDIQTTQTLVGFGCSPTYDSDNTLDRSPQQLQMYQSSLVKTTITAQEIFGALISESALYRVSRQSLDSLLGQVINILRDDWWSELITLTPINIEYEIKRIIHTVTLSDVNNGYITFLDDPTIAHVEYLVKLPEDTTGDVSIILKECYGIEYGDSSTWDCGTCEYVDDCKTADFLDPFYMDEIFPNRYNLTVSSVLEGERLRIKYKKATIV